MSTTHITPMGELFGALRRLPDAEILNVFSALRLELESRELMAYREHDADALGDHLYLALNTAEAELRARLDDVPARDEGPTYAELA